MRCIEIKAGGIGVVKLKNILLVLGIFTIILVICFSKREQQSEFNLANLNNSPTWVYSLREAKNAKQLFVVAGVSDTTAYVSMHEKDDNGIWKEIVTTPGFIGKNGLGKTKEGDSLTPVGTFHFTEAFGIEEDPGVSFGYKKVTEDDYWSGDEKCMYNSMVSQKDYPNLDKDNSEHIIEYDPHYRYCLNISYNEENVPGKGSAIFLHCFGPCKPYTGGCVSIPKECMLKVMKNVNKDCVVVIDSLKNLSPETWKEWEL